MKVYVFSGSFIVDDTDANDFVVLAPTKKRAYVYIEEALRKSPMYDAADDYNEYLEGAIKRLYLDTPRVHLVTGLITGIRGDGRENLI